MSVSITIPEYTSIYSLQSVGFSHDSKTIENMMDEILIKLEKTETLGYKEKIIQSLDKVLEECSEEGWDGYDATPITEESYNEAKKLIKFLPLIADAIIPEVVPEPNGEIALEWYKGKRSVFIASVCGKNEIVYAGLFGISKTHGTEYFGGSLPLAISDNLRRLNI